ncbi:hypothetical protein NIES4073_51240 [Kalymmatonema gypsitolerans NIES-4073]|jgi:hypothetical protein|nr:hypothetical protein NIES4073_51240 [Scytonema sp. NIES-4073]
MTEFLAVRVTLTIPTQRTQGAEILFQSSVLQE